MIRIEHIALWSDDIEQLKDFYTHYFGAKANDKYTNSTKQFSSYFLSFSQGVRLELMQNPNVMDCSDTAPQYPSGFVHFALSLGSEKAVDELTSKMKNDGVKVIDGPRRTGDGYYESVIQDPQGNQIELTA